MASRTPTAPDDLARTIPGLRQESYWSAERDFQKALLRRLGDHRPFATPYLERMGELAAREVAPLAAVADREEPRLVTHDLRGIRVDRVEFHPAYGRMEDLSYGENLIGLKYDQAVRKAHGAVLHTLGFGLAYLFSQAECGLFCPICMTDGAARVLERHATKELRDRLVPRLAAREADRRYSGAMFLTEAQGGSDVGLTATVAREAADGTARLTGKKWFCSNVNAQVILTLARPGGSQGTAGLGLYVIVRDPEEGHLPGFYIDRLKPKLGVRSMATGEVTLENVPAWRVGEPGKGFHAMAEMINLSRLYNSVAAVGAVRRGLYEASHYGRERKAFGKALVDHPLFAQVLALVASRHRAATNLVFDAVGFLDGADGGDRIQASRLRLMTPLIKYHTGQLAVWGVSQCVEALGGNGYIEEYPLARLLRDAQVLPIWEGSSNIQLLDFCRAIQKERAHLPLLAALGEALSTLTHADLMDPIRRELTILQESLASIATTTEPPPGLRNMVDRLAWIYGVLSLATGPEGNPTMARLLLAAGPGTGEGFGPWGSVPPSWAHELVRTL